MSTGGEGTADRRLDLLQPQLAAEHRDVDHLAGGLRGAHPRGDLHPERIEARRPLATLTTLAQRQRAGHRPGLSGEQLQVVVELGGGLTAAAEALVAGDDRRRDPQPDQADRDRVAVPADRDQSLGVDPGPGGLGAVEGLGRKRPQKRRLARERLADSLTTAADGAAEVGRAGGEEAGVQLGEVGELGDRDEVVAAEAADLALDAALLVGALFAAAGELRGEQVMGAQGDEAIGFQPPAASEHLRHGRAQVVVADGRKGAAEEGEGADVALEEGLLGLASEGLAEAGPRKTGAHQEQWDGAALAAEADLGLAPVDLGLGGGVVDQGHEGFIDQDAELGPALSHVAADLALGDRGAALVDQPPIDAVGGVALLAWRLAVSDQPGVDRLVVGSQCRRRAPGRLLSRRRQRRGQSLAHRPAVDAVALGQDPDRGSISVVISA